MRILHLAESFWPRIGGQEIFVQRLAKAQQARGHDCLVVTNQLDGASQDSDKIDGLSVRRLPLARALFQRDIRAIAKGTAALREIVLAWRPDLIHLHDHRSVAFFFLRLNHAANIPAVYTTHCAYLHSDRMHTQTACLLDSVQRIAATSQAMHAQTIRIAPQAAQKVRLIYLGLELPTVAPTPLPKNPPILFAAARLAREKGLDILLQGLAAILAEIPDLKVVIAGDGPERSALQRLSEQEGLAQAVSFPGWLDPRHIASEIDASTLIVSPSRAEETFGLVLLQAMQMSRPVIASRIGAFPELVADGETGLLFTPDHSEALSHAVLTILKNPVLAAEMGRRGRERAQALFDWERCLDEYEDLYRELRI